MKKVIITVSIMLGLGLTQANGQEVRGGIKVDANTSNFILTDMDGMKSKLGFGASIGGYTKIALGENFALQPEFLLHFKTSKMENEVLKSEVDYQYFGAELPIYAVAQKKFGEGLGFVGIGPYVGVGFDARYRGDGSDDLELYKEYGGQESIMQRWDFGVGLILGYELSNRLQITASYKIGFVNALRNSDDAKMWNQTISLGLGYRF
jgi:hypothetical protein